MGKVIPFPLTRPAVPLRRVPLVFPVAERWQSGDRSQLWLLVASFGVALLATLALQLLSS